MFNINWPQLISELLPRFYRARPIIAAWFAVLISPVRDLHATFLLFRQDVLYKSRFTGQIIYMEKRLNDRYDPIARGIYIDNVIDFNYVFIFNSSELATPRYLYNNYSAATTYQVGQYAQTSTGVYRCTVISTGHFPDTSPIYWLKFSDPLYLQNRVEYTSMFDFIVMVPIAVMFDINEMKSIVNYYKIAGKRYTIQTY